MIAELSAIFELLSLLILDPRTGVLIALLAIAAVIDLRSHRIPNWLVFCGLAFALLYNGFGPQGRGALDYSALGWMDALQGMGVGFGLMLPFYLMRVMGAGDVKLMAMTGAFLGCWQGLMAVLFTFAAGGVLAICYMLIRGVLARAMRNMHMLTIGAVQAVVSGGRPDMTLSTRETAGRLAYGLAIATGSTGYLVLHQLRLIQL